MWSKPRIGWPIPDSTPCVNVVISTPASGWCAKAGDAMADAMAARPVIYFIFKSPPVPPTGVRVSWTAGLLTRGAGYCLLPSPSRFLTSGRRGLHVAHSRGGGCGCWPPKWVDHIPHSLLILVPSKDGHFGTVPAVSIRRCRQSCQHATPLVFCLKTTITLFIKEPIGGLSLHVKGLIAKIF